MMNESEMLSSNGKSFDLITLSRDTDNQNGAFYTSYHEAIQREETEGYGIWLVDSNSNFKNYSANGPADSTVGIEPGSSGVIKFYIKPYENVTIDFTFQTIGYTSKIETVDGQQRVKMTELPADVGDPACFLNGHVLLFEKQDAETQFYSGLIPSDADGKRTFTRTFSVGGPFVIDTDNDGTNDSYEVDIYWVWPETFDTLVYNNPETRLICNKDSAAVQGETYNDYSKVVNYICSNPHRGSKLYL